MSIEAIRYQVDFLMADHVPARYFGAIGSGEIHRNSLPPAGAIDRLAVDLKAAHPEHVVPRQTAQLLADSDFAA